MFSPVKEINYNVRMNPNKNKYIIKGRRKIKSIEEIKNYESKEFSK
jgi:hypothetical protein